MDELSITAAVLPELEALRGVEQNPNHHLDVHGHTLAVLTRLLEVEAELDRFAGDRAGEVQTLLAQPLGDDFSRAAALRFGALVHDVGKPATRGRRGDYVDLHRPRSRGGARSSARSAGGCVPAAASPPTCRA